MVACAARRRRIRSIPRAEGTQRRAVDVNVLECQPWVAGCNATDAGWLISATGDAQSTLSSRTPWLFSHVARASRLRARHRARLSICR